MNAGQIVRERLKLDAPAGLRLGTPREIGPLSLVPVHGDGPAADYVPYSTAHAEGLVSVRELDHQGAVPTLMVNNVAPSPVLLVEGEILIGLKQNRVLNVSVLVPARSEVAIPVACVEAGRWRFSSTAGLKDEFHLSPKVRGTKNRSVAEAARQRGDFNADQGAVWDGVAERLASHGVDSETAAYSDIGARRRTEIVERAAAVRPEPGQRGVLALVGGEPLCLDLFDRDETLTALWDGLVGSYVSDAMIATDGDRSVDLESVRAWVHGLANADATEHPGVALGSTVVATTSDATATALVMGEAVVHLAAFRRDNSSERGSRFVPPSGRVR